MSSTTPPDPNPIVACTISRDVKNFDLLIEDMESALGDRWGDLSFDEAPTYFAQPEAESLEFVALAMNDADEDDLPRLSEIISRAKAQNIGVILIAEDVSPAALHQLLRHGADAFVPYPLPEGELQEAIDRLSAPPPAARAPSGPTLDAGSSKEGAVIVVQGLAGGAGATTLATNLAWDLALLGSEGAPGVALIDLDLQFGSVATYLDLPRREAVYEMLSDTEALDADVFAQALVSYEDKLQVLTAPSDILPLDILSPDDVARVIDLARRHFDFVVIDMPSTLVQWSETVLQAAHVYFAVIELDMRSAQNALRLKRALQSEDLPFNKLRFALNRAPGFADLGGKGRAKRMAESLGISIDLQLPDGGKAVAQGGDHGLPLAASAPKNPLRKEIAKLAKSLHELGRGDAAEAA